MFWILFLCKSLLTNYEKEVELDFAIKVGDLYVDKTEVTNIHWLEFLYFKEMEGKERVNIPDPGINPHFRYPTNRWKPCTGITYEQAVAYCKWRSAVLSAKMDRQVICRLPTSDEWDQIANHLIDERMGFLKREMKRTRRFLSRHETSFALLTFEKGSRTRVRHFFTNVSEMTSEKGVAKGGNNSRLINPERNPGEIFHYSHPAKWLGFRCLTEVR